MTVEEIRKRIINSGLHPDLKKLRLECLNKGEYYEPRMSLKEDFKEYGKKN